MTVRVRESFSFSGGAVDRSGKYPVVRGVLLCGRESAWKRRYLPEAFAGDKVKVYEGRPVYFDHTAEKGGRRFADKVGWTENVRHNADGLPVGDIGVNPKAAHAEAFLWAAENKPDYCSMSHVADIDARPAGDGWSEVRECRYVESVDVVTSGATTSTLYSEGSDRPGRGAAAGRVNPDRECEVAAECLAAGYRPTRERFRQLAALPADRRREEIAREGRTTRAREAADALAGIAAADFGRGPVVTDEEVLAECDEVGFAPDEEDMAALQKLPDRRSRLEYIRSRVLGALDGIAKDLNSADTDARAAAAAHPSAADTAAEGGRPGPAAGARELMAALSRELRGVR